MNDLEEIPDSGMRVSRDEHGQFEKVEVDDGWAQRMHDAKKEKRERGGDLGDALCQLLISPDDPKAQAFELVIRKLASRQSDKSIELLLALLGQRAGLVKPKYMEQCALCGETMGAKKAPQINISDEVAEWLFKERPDHLAGSERDDIN